MSRIAITRGVSATINDCELTHVPRTPIDVAHAREQHAAYESGLASLGCEIRRIPADDRYPDAVFIEDTAIVLDDARGDHPSRRGSRAAASWTPSPPSSPSTARSRASNAP